MQYEIHFPCSHSLPFDILTAEMSFLVRKAFGEQFSEVPIGKSIENEIFINVHQKWTPNTFISVAFLESTVLLAQQWHGGKSTKPIFDMILATLLRFHEIVKKISCYYLNILFKN